MGSAPDVDTEEVCCTSGNVTVNIGHSMLNLMWERMVLEKILIGDE
jgi:hypothetical protein